MGSQSPSVLSVFPLTLPQVSPTSVSVSVKCWLSISEDSYAGFLSALMLLILVLSSEWNLNGISCRLLFSAVFTIESMHAFTRQHTAQAFYIDLIYSHTLPILCFQWLPLHRIDNLLLSSLYLDCKMKRFKLLKPLEP